MTDTVPLSSLLSQLLVALTIEIDNAFEQRMPHRTTVGGGLAGARGPWLTSMVTWSNLLRFVPADGASVEEVSDLIGLVNFGGLRRWRYLDLELPDGSAAAANAKPEPGRFIRPTPGGRAAATVWAPLADEIEQRWRERFGDQLIGELRSTLRAVSGELGGSLPLSPPVLGFGNGMRLAPELIAAIRPRCTVAELDLPALLSRVLVAFALDYEAESELSITLAANMLRAFPRTSTPVRDLPALCGVSTEAAAALLKFLTARRLVESDQVNQLKTVRLTPAGHAARQHHDELTGSVEQRWHRHFTPTAITALRSSLSRVREHRTNGVATIGSGLQPPAGGWRSLGRYAAHTSAICQDPRTALPHYPVISHRGGFPDGS